MEIDLRTFMNPFTEYMWNIQRLLEKWSSLIGGTATHFTLRSFNFSGLNQLTRHNPKQLILAISLLNIFGRGCEISNGNLPIGDVFLTLYFVQKNIVLRVSRVSVNQLQSVNVLLCRKIISNIAKIITNIQWIFLE